jgi:hypothetical protein
MFNVVLLPRQIKAVPVMELPGTEFVKTVNAAESEIYVAPGTIEIKHLYKAPFRLS